MPKSSGKSYLTAQSKKTHILGWGAKGGAKGTQINRLGDLNLGGVKMKLNYVRKK